MPFNVISDLFGHQEWADSIHWRAFASHPGALDDDAIRRRLYHIQAVQRSFLSVWRGAPAWPEPFESYATAEALRDAARATHRDVAAFLEDADTNRLEENVIVPWFPTPQRPIRVVETMRQVTMHSHGHRCQNAVRLRELGGAAPMTDYIAWILDGRPAPVWP